MTISFVERARAYCELRTTRNRIKTEMRGDPCTEMEPYDYETGAGALACFLETGGEGERLALEGRCEACQRNEKRYLELTALASKMGGAHRAMLTAWGREYDRP